ncbi:MAG TPA: GNAT family N-acetyltransferase [Candidatus Limnocylindrales bacterium]|nr:GNAT family N-acetyltransferase [Candidatus Limnocylindrales bacterium]
MSAGSDDRAEHGPADDGSTDGWPADRGLVVRRATAADADAIADVYLASFHATYSFPLAHTDDEVRRWIREVVIVSPEAWVAVDDERVVGMLVVGSGALDQLYVAPDRLGTGIGRRLLDTARERSPQGLTLYTFQVNDRARRFYERNGFVTEAFGDGTANDERQPDVRYAWRPGSVPSR